MIRSRWAAALCCSLVACAPPPATTSAGALSEPHRLALADTIRALTDSVVAAASRRDAVALTARFRLSPEAAFGGAGAMVLRPDQLRDNMATAYRTLRSQQLAVMEQRVAILGPDAAATTGWGSFTAEDTTGASATGIQAFTFVWARDATGWGVIQAHFSAQMGRVNQAPRSPGP